MAKQLPQIQETKNKELEGLKCRMYKVAFFLITEVGMVLKIV